MPPLNVTIIHLLAPSHQLTRLCIDNGTTTRKIRVIKSQKNSRIIVDILNKCLELCIKSLRKRVKYHHGIWTGCLTKIWTGCLTKIYQFCLRCCILFWSINLCYYRKLFYPWATGAPMKWIHFEILDNYNSKIIDFSDKLAARQSSILP